jgi:proteasome alpha subunit
MYDGTLVDEQGMSVLGGDAEAISARLSETWRKEDDLRAAVRGCVAALCGPDRTLGADDTEVAVLSRSNGRRCFRRLDDVEVSGFLA